MGIYVRSVREQEKMSYESARTYAGHMPSKMLDSFSHYKLRCQSCDQTFEDDGLLLECPTQHESSLLVTEYKAKRFEPDRSAEGIFKYRKWLPGTRGLSGAGSSVTYKSEKLNSLIGLLNVWVVFNGYWPEKGAVLETPTFKDLEAWAVLSRIPEQHEEVLIVASAGSTAAAFARACSLNKVSCLIIIPQAGLLNLQFPEGIDPCVKIISLTGFTDYSDAIELANRVSRIDGFFSGGGVKNVARRDGLGTTMLNAVETIGQVPDYYFQAIGSGAGGIAAYQAAKRLVEDGRFGKKLPRLMLSQNLPFVPIYLSWKSCRRELIEISEDDGKKQIRQVGAHVLTNRHPAYSVRGGVFDILTETQGDMFTADNLEALHAKQLFEETEGIDIDPACAVAFATLIKTARYGGIERDALVLLNVTGGGRHRQQLDRKLIAARPALELNEKEILRQEALERVVDLVH
ncbi:MAG: cysteate synthase [Rubrobacter sp.]|nr:cysteate synthase [Rubrobacter sp.]